MEQFEVLHTQDEVLRDYLKPEAVAKVVDIATKQEPLGEEEMNEPHEYNGFGD